MRRPCALRRHAPVETAPIVERGAPFPVVAMFANAGKSLCLRAALAPTVRRLTPRFFDEQGPCWTLATTGARFNAQLRCIPELSQAPVMSREYAGRRLRRFSILDLSGGAGFVVEVLRS